MKITVLMGGTSAERDVSIASGLRIAAALRTRGHDVTSLDTANGVIDDATARALLAAGVQQAPPDLESLAAMSQRSLSPSARHVAGGATGGRGVSRIARRTG